MGTRYYAPDRAHAEAHTHPTTPRDIAGYLVHEVTREQVIHDNDVLILETAYDILGEFGGTASADARAAIDRVLGR